MHPGVTKAVENGKQWLAYKDAADGSAFLATSKTGGQTPYMVSTYLPPAVVARIAEQIETPLVLSAQIRGQDLTGNAVVMIQIFARKQGAERDHFVTNLTTKPAVTGTTGWTPSQVRFRLGDILMPEDTLTRLEIVLRNASNTGQADFDAVSLTFANQ